MAKSRERKVDFGHFFEACTFRAGFCDSLATCKIDQIQLTYLKFDYFLILDLVDLIFFNELLNAYLQERMGST